MISRKAVKRKTTPAKAGTAVLEVEDRRRMARLVGKVEGDAKRAEKRRYQEACIREGHLTNCLSKDLWQASNTPYRTMFQCMPSCTVPKVAAIFETSTNISPT